jgi:hypothetical protein
MKNSSLMLVMAWVSSSANAARSAAEGKPVALERFEVIVDLTAGRLSWPPRRGSEVSRALF